MTDTARRMMATKDCDSPCAHSGEHDYEPWLTGCPAHGCTPIEQASASVGLITGALAADIERYKDDPEYLREHIAIRDGEIAAQAQEIADLKDALNRALESSSIAESARLNGLREIARLKAALEGLHYFMDGFMPKPAEHEPVAAYEGMEDQWLQCSSVEAGHMEGNCPQDVDDDDEIMPSFPFGELRAVMDAARAALKEPQE